MLTREEFESYIVSRASDVTKVGSVMRFVDGVFQLQNDRSRPVYIFEVGSGISEGEVALLDAAMNQLGVACVLVPSGIVRYSGEVTADSFGTRSLADELMGSYWGLERGR